MKWYASTPSYPPTAPVELFPIINPLPPNLLPAPPCVVVQLLILSENINTHRALIAREEANQRRSWRRQPYNMKHSARDPSTSHSSRMNNGYTTGDERRDKYDAEKARRELEEKQRMERPYKRKSRGRPRPRKNTSQDNQSFRHEARQHSPSPLSAKKERRGRQDRRSTMKSATRPPARTEMDNENRRRTPSGPRPYVSKETRRQSQSRHNRASSIYDQLQHESHRRILYGPRPYVSNPKKFRQTPIRSEASRKQTPSRHSETPSRQILSRSPPPLTERRKVTPRQRRHSYHTSPTQSRQHTPSQPPPPLIPVQRQYISSGRPTLKTSELFEKQRQILEEQQRLYRTSPGRRTYRPSTSVTTPSAVDPYKQARQQQVRNQTQKEFLKHKNSVANIRSQYENSSHEARAPSPRLEERRKFVEALRDERLDIRYEDSSYDAHGRRVRGFRDERPRRRKQQFSRSRLHLISPGSAYQKESSESERPLPSPPYELPLPKTPPKVTWQGKKKGKRSAAASRRSKDDDRRRRASMWSSPYDERGHQSSPRKGSRALPSLTYISSSISSPSRENRYHRPRDSHRLQSPSREGRDSRLTPEYKYNQHRPFAHAPSRKASAYHATPRGVSAQQRMVQEAIAKFSSRPTTTNTIFSSNHLINQMQQPIVQGRQHQVVQQQKHKRSAPRTGEPEFPSQPVSSHRTSYDATEVSHRTQAIQVQRRSASRNGKAEGQLMLPLQRAPYHTAHAPRIASGYYEDPYTSEGAIIQAQREKELKYSAWKRTDTQTALRYNRRLSVHPREPEGQQQKQTSIAYSRERRPSSRQPPRETEAQKTLRRLTKDCQRKSDAGQQQERRYSTTRDSREPETHLMLRREREHTPPQAEQRRSSIYQRPGEVEAKTVIRRLKEGTPRKTRREMMQEKILKMKKSISDLRPLPSPRR